MSKVAWPPCQLTPQKKSVAPKKFTREEKSSWSASATAWVPRSSSSDLQWMVMGALLGWQLWIATVMPFLVSSIFWLALARPATSDNVPKYNLPFIYF